MNVRTLARIAKTLGAQDVNERANKVSCSCLMAPWTHTGGRDRSPSMVLFPQGRHGDPIYSCKSCHEKGALRDLVCFVWSKTRHNLLHLIELIDGEATGEKIPDEVVDLALYTKSRRLIEEGGEEKRRLRKLRRLAEKDGVPWTDRLALEAADSVPEIPWSHYEPFAGSVPRYALERGLTLDTCREWELGHDKRGRRLLLPMRDRKGRLVAISGRLYEEKYCQRCGGQYVKIDLGGKKPKTVCGNCGRKPPPKYLHNKGFKRNLHLYGENKVPEANERLWLVEGHLDVLKLWQAGYRPVVGMMGSEPGGPQIERLVAMTTRLIIVPDGDKAGDSMAALVKRAITDRILVTVVPTPREKDPGDLDTAMLLALLGVPPFSVAA